MPVEVGVCSLSPLCNLYFFFKETEIEFAEVSLFPSIVRGGGRGGGVPLIC